MLYGEAAGNQNYIQGGWNRLNFFSNQSVDGTPGPRG